MADALASLPLPPCPECGEVLKPAVVMFGELLPADAIDARSSWRRKRISSSSWARPSRCIRSPRCPGERFPRAGARDRQPRHHALGLARGPRPRRRAGETLGALASALGMVEATDRGGAMADQTKDLLAG
jgi:hypothetical protein